MGTTWSQLFPPRPTFTDANLPSLEGKVFIVTGGYSGIGFEICSMLYRGGGKVYVAGRDTTKAKDAIARIRAASPPDSKGELCFLKVDLADLRTVKPAVEEFTTQESRLHVLFNNAGVTIPGGPVSAQGHELMMATNCLGPYLLTQLLLPTLLHTARKASGDDPSTQVRVTWTTSIVVDTMVPKKPTIETLSRPSPVRHFNYAHSKMGNWLLAASLASEAGANRGGILSVAYNPGNLKTDLLRDTPAFVRWLLSSMLYGANLGAYTALWSAFSPQLRLEEHGGAGILPPGMLHPSPRADLLAATRSVEDGGTGLAEQYREFCEDETKAFR